MLSACNDQDRKDRADTNNQNAPKLEDPTKNTSDKTEEVVDFSWVPESEVNCADSSCVPSTAIVFAKLEDDPNRSDRLPDYEVCMGVLIADDVMAISGKCLPSDVASGDATCKSRIFVKFPKVESILDERGIGCEQVVRFNKPENKLLIIDKDTPKNKTFAPSFAVVKLSERVQRSFERVNSLVSFSRPDSHWVGKYDLENRSDYSLSTIECPVIRNGINSADLANEQEGSLTNTIALDCDLGMQASGNPMYSLGGLIGIVDNSKVHLPQADSDSNPSANSIAHLGFSSACVLEDLDCAAKALSNFLFGPALHEESRVIENFQNLTRDFLDDHPLTALMEWEVVEDIADLHGQ